MGSAGVVFMVSTMISLTSSLGWNDIPVSLLEETNPDVFFMFFIWPLVCLVVFAGLQAYSLYLLQPSWPTIGTVETARSRQSRRPDQGHRANMRMVQHVPFPFGCFLQQAWLAPC